MNCPKCGIDAGEFKFCPECGFELRETKPSSEEEIPKDSASSVEIQPEKIEKATSTEGNPSVAEQSEAYLLALKALEKEKEEKKQAQKANSLKTMKKAIKIGCVVLLGVLVILGIVAVSHGIKSQKKEIQSMEASIESGSSYTQTYTNWVKNTNPSEAKKKKVLLQLGSYAFDKDKITEGLYFFTQLNDTGDENYRKKAIPIFDTEFQKLAKENNYISIMKCCDTYKKLGGQFDAKIIDDAVEKLFEKGDYHNAIALLKNADQNEVSLDKTKLSDWAVHFAESKNPNAYYQVLNYMSEANIKYDQAIEESLISFANESLKSGDYEKALLYLNAYHGQTDHTELDQKCNLWLGAKAFEKKEYSQAAKYLESFYGNTTDYKNANKLYICALMLDAMEQAYDNSSSLEESARSSLKSKLRNPSSYIEYSCWTYVTVRAEEGKDGKPAEYVVYQQVSISYGATNGFGGYNRDTYYYPDILSPHVYKRIEAKGLTYEELKELKDMKNKELVSLVL